MIWSVLIPFSIVNLPTIDLSKAEQLPETFKSPIPEDHIKHYEYEFHSANHQLMITVVIALRDLIVNLHTKLYTDKEDCKYFEKQTLVEFIRYIFKPEITESEAFQKVCVKEATPPQIHYLASLPLTAIYKCLKLFIGWIEEGVYDYCMLPFPFKVHMRLEDKKSIENLCQRWQFNLPLCDLLKELEQLIDTLKLSEQNIIHRVNEATNVCTTNS